MGYYDPPDPPFPDPDDEDPREEPNYAICPKCDAEQIDEDGFGVLYCGACGYCTHASVDGGVCSLCGAVEVGA